MGLAGIAAETLKVLDDGGYAAPSGRWVDLRASIDAAVAGTCLHRPGDWAPATGPHATTLEVTGEGTAEAGQRLVGEGERVAVLNFASARNVGGGFLGGARAQEEELCRASALYPCLASCREYYDANRTERSALYTDHLISSPDVPFFRDRSRAFVEAPYALTVLTSPAPNTGALPAREPRIAETFERRATQVLAVARELGHDVVVLGAWGCGAFQGDPEVAAEAFGRALDGPMKGAFRRVVFAVLVKAKRDRRNLEVFRQRFGA